MSAATLAASKHLSDKNKFNLICRSTWKSSNYDFPYLNHKEGKDDAGTDVDVFSVDLTEMKYIQRDEYGRGDIANIASVTDDKITLMDDETDSGGGATYPQNEHDLEIIIDRKSGAYDFTRHINISPGCDGCFPRSMHWLDKTGSCTKAPFTPFDYVAPNKF